MADAGAVQRLVEVKTVCWRTAMNAAAGAKPRKFPIVDVDVHHNFKNRSDLFPYIAVQRERFAETVRRAGPGRVQRRQARPGIAIIDENDPPPARYPAPSPRPWTTTRAPAARPVRIDPRAI